MSFLPCTQQLLFYVRRRPNANSVLWQLTHSAYCFSLLSLSQHQLSCPQGSPSHESVTKRVNTQNSCWFPTRDLMTQRLYDTKRWLSFFNLLIYTRPSSPLLFFFNSAWLVTSLVSAPPSPAMGDTTAMSPVASYCPSMATQKSSQLGNWVATVGEAPPQRFYVFSCAVDNDAWHTRGHKAG